MASLPVVFQGDGRCRAVGLGQVHDLQRIPRGTASVCCHVSNSNGVPTSPCGCRSRWRGGGAGLDPLRTGDGPQDQLTPVPSLRVRGENTLDTFLSLPLDVPAGSFPLPASQTCQEDARHAFPRLVPIRS